MERFTSSWTDEQFDLMLAYVLRAGVLMSASIIAAGGVVFLSVHGWERPTYHVFRGEPIPLRSIGGILSEVQHVHGRGLVQFGLLLLIATPIGGGVFGVGLCETTRLAVCRDYADRPGAAQLQSSVRMRSKRPR